MMAVHPAPVSIRVGTLFPPITTVVRNLQRPWVKGMVGAVEVGDEGARDTAEAATRQGGV